MLNGSLYLKFGYFKTISLSIHLCRFRNKRDPPVVVSLADVGTTMFILILRCFFGKFVAHCTALDAVLAWLPVQGLWASWVWIALLGRIWTGRPCHSVTVVWLCLSVLTTFDDSTRINTQCCCNIFSRQSRDMKTAQQCADCKHYPSWYRLRKYRGPANNKCSPSSPQDRAQKCVVAALATVAIAPGRNGPWWYNARAALSYLGTNI